jgi:hypothetical protein
MAHKPLKDYLACVAIDIGTTGTGYAYSTREDFREDQTGVTLNEKWTDQSQGLPSLKAPTCLLLDPKMQFHAFGYEAENKYAELAAEGSHENWFYFERFKMQLFKNEVSSAFINFIHESIYFIKVALDTIHLNHSAHLGRFVAHLTSAV